MNILCIDIEDEIIKEVIMKLADSRLNFISYSLSDSDIEINDFSVVIYSNFIKNESKLKILRGLNRNSEFIYISDYYKNDIIQKAINAHLVDYLFFKKENYLEKILEILNIKTLDAKVENKSLNMAKSMVTSFYIYNLIYGDMKKLDMLIDLVEKYNLEINPNVSIVLMIDNFWEEVRSLDNKNRYEIKKEYLDYVNDFIDKNNIQAIACTLFGTDKIAILLNIDKDNQKDSINYSTKLAIKLKEYINLKAKHTVTIGVGSLFQNPKYLRKSYEEAFKCLDYSFYVGSDKVIHYEETKDLTLYNEANKNKLPQLKYNFYKNLNSWDAEQIISHHKNAIHYLTRLSFNRETIKSIVIKYNFEVIEYLEKINCIDKSLKDFFLDITSKILRSTTIDSINELNTSFIKKVAQNIKSNKNFFTLDNGLESSRAFIELYYYRDLTLEDIAQVANLSNSYFSRKFKEKYKMNYIQYLEFIRLNKAKELIINTDLIISEISYAVGFKDPSYFSNRFKKEFNIAPSKFKEVNQDLVFK